MSLAAALEPSWAVLAIALALDLLAGEPSNRFHPVAWMGRLAAALMTRAPRSGAGRQLAFGALVAAAVPLGFALASALLAAVAASVGALAGIAIFGVLLKSTFSLRGLGEAATEVRRALAGGNLAAGRERLRSLCSRDPASLAEPEVVAATVESVAENASDSFVAPL
ncbi:MAG: cobalamin biosynthesis protein, partial [Chloroflexi bacterium]|nr:cobalamin biosynthesis protein [Chloroflexota bacterium]